MNAAQIKRIPTMLKVDNVAFSKKMKLFLYGDIGTDYFDGISLEKVENKLRYVNGIEEIEVHINSYGGDVFEAIAIMNYLKHGRNEKITTFIDGIAASGGSIIFMAGEERYMPKNSMLLVHNALTGVYGNAADLRRAANDLDKISESVKECYLANFIGDKEELSELMNKDDFLKADESNAFGFATNLLDDIDLSEVTDPIDNSLDIKNRLLEKYSNVKPEIKEKNNIRDNVIENFINMFKEEK